MDLRCRPDTTLPRLGWIATVDHRAGAVEVAHGRDVETAERFVVEGVWDGAFDAGDFVSSAHFFGSGLRVDSAGAVFSPSRALVDRLFSCRTDAGHMVSNSLLLLLGAIGSALAAGRTYLDETYTILEGIDAYEPRYEVAGAGPFRQHYFHPFRVTADGCEDLEVPATPPFADYADYAARLDAAVAGIVANASSPTRRAGALEPRMTLSSGYDSPAVAAVVARHCRPLAYTSTRSNATLPRWMSHRVTVDDGTPVAEALGLPVRHLEEDFSALDERLFLAGGSVEPETIFGSMATEVAASVRPSLVFSGYHGDKVWALDPGERYLDAEIRRGDVSGLPLAEVRLEAGFVHCALPFVGAREAGSIVRVAQSDEMRPWRVGGSYDRPVPRRLAEEAGVPREAFGQRKRAVVESYVMPRTRAHRAGFERWLRANAGMGLGRYRLRGRLSRGAWAAERLAQAVLARAGGARTEPVMWRWLPGRGPEWALYRWAVESLVEEGLGPRGVAGRADRSG